MITMAWEINLRVLSTGSADVRPCCSLEDTFLVSCPFPSRSPVYSDERQ
jgi:hypothetical protein